MKNHILKVIIFIIFLWGIVLRAPEVLSGNYLFGFDHGRDYLAAMSIVDKGKLTLIGPEVGAGSAGLTGLFHGPGYFYLIALMYKIFGGDPYGGLLLMFFFGVSALLISYYAGYKLFGRWGAVISLLMVGISPLIAPQSRFIWNHHPTTPFIFISFLCAYLAVSRPVPFMPISLFIAGIIYHFELAIAVPLVIGLCIGYLLFYKVTNLKIWVVNCFVLVLAFFPMLVFESRHGFMATKGLVTYVFSQKETKGIPLSRIQDHFGSYISNGTNTFMIEGGFIPSNWYVYVIGFLIISVLIYQWKTRDIPKRKFIRLLLTIMGVSYGIFLLLNNTVWDYYLIHIHIIFIFFFVLIWDWGRANYKNILGTVIIGFMSALLCSQVVGSVQRAKLNYQVDMNDFGGVEKIRGKRMVVDTIYQNAAGKPFSVYVYHPAIYVYPYEYLFATYGKRYFGYAPLEASYKPSLPLNGIVYLVIESDGGKPVWLSGWLDTVVPGGTTQLDITLKSGHRIIRKIYP